MDMSHSQSSGGQRESMCDHSVVQDADSGTLDIETKDLENRSERDAL